MDRAARTICLAAMLAGSLIAPASSAAQDSDRLRIRVVPRYTPAPGSMRVIAWVEPDERNRRLIVEVDSAALYRSSEVPLDGDQSARRHALTFTHLPAGTYEIRVHVHGIDTDLMVVRSFSVTRDGSH